MKINYIIFFFLLIKDISIELLTNILSLVKKNLLVNAMGIIEELIQLIV